MQLKVRGRESKFHSDRILINSLINVPLSHAQERDSVPSVSLHMINQTGQQSILLHKFMIIYDKLTQM